LEKKLLFVLVGLLVFSSFSYSQTKDDYGEFGGTYCTVKGSEGSFSGWGLNLAGITYFSNTVGLGVYGNVVYAVPYEDVNVILINMLLGPSFKFIKTEQFSIPITVGFSAVYGFLFGGGGSGQAYNFGVGANLSLEVKLSETMHLYGRIQGAYGFLGGGSLVIAPSIGIGF
jgi:hypothetical protein